MLENADGELLRLGGGHCELSAGRLQTSQHFFCAGIDFVLVQSLITEILAVIGNGLFRILRRKTIVLHKGILQRRAYETVQACAVLHFDPPLFQRVHHRIGNAKAWIGQRAV